MMRRLGMDERLNDVAYLLSWGLTSVEIAEELGVHRITVQRYRAELKKQFFSRNL